MGNPEHNEGSAIFVSRLTTADLDAVDELMKRNVGTLGFLPHAAINDYLQKNGVLGANDQYGRLIGYLMFAANRDRFRIAQLCVSESFRGQGIGRQLVESLKASAETQKLITLRCRNDFPAHEMWPNLGFVPTHEKPGRSKEGHPLTLWRLQLAPHDQLELFRANLSDDVLDAVIDAQILFDFDAPPSELNQPSKALISDLFVDSLNLWYTDELLSEISRSSRPSQREEARTRARQLHEVKHNPLLVDGFVEKLTQILPSHRQNQLSDIMHLAKTAASEIDSFVTRDRALLSKASQIHGAVGVQVLSRTELILKLRELAETHPHAPEFVSGLGLSWRILTSNDLSAIPFSSFLQDRERPRELQTRIGSFLTDVSRTEVEVLWSDSQPIALRVLTYNSPNALTVPLCRLSSSITSSAIRRFPILDVIQKAVSSGREMVKVEEDAIPRDYLPALLEMGFTRCDSGFLRFCIPHYLELEAALSRISELAADCSGNYESMSPLELERSCSPLISDLSQNYYLIPIRPSYARSLVDRHLSSSDMFGGDPDVLLRWNNVYYRAATQQYSLQAPGRILWYISGNSGEIAAVSHLDEVVLDQPKELFQRFRRHGTFEWRDLYMTCGGDLSRKVMALRFSHTFGLQKRVPLREIRRVFNEDGVRGLLQSPRKIPPGTFRKLFDLGYPEQP